jgi:hypothetical protein
MSETENGTTPPANTGGNSSEPPAWYNNPPEWLKNAPNNGAANAPQSAGPSRNDLMGAIGGLPDQIVNAIREAFPATPPANAPSNPPASGESNAPANTPPAAESTPGKSSSFADWWFKG